MMHSIDAGGRLVSVSDHWLRTFGYERDEVIGRRMIEFLTDASQYYAQTVALPEFFKTGYVEDMQAEFVKRNGDIMNVLLSAIAERNEVGGFVRSLAVLIDITKRKQAEAAQRQSQAELRRLNQQLEDYSQNLEQKVAERTHEIERRRQVAEGLRDMLTILNSNRPLNEILDYIIAEASRLLGTQSGAIYRLQADQELFTVQASRGLPTEYVADLSFPLRRSFLGQAVLNRRPVVISDLAAALGEQDIGLDLQRQAILASHYHTLLAVPLLRQGDSEQSDEIYGGIGLYYPTWRQFSDEEIGLAVAFADQATLAIENARLRQRVEQVAVIEERARLARELHDSVTQALYSSTFFAEAGRQLAEAGDAAGAAHRLTRIGEIIQQALKEMRLLVYQLRPPVLEQEGLVGALRQRLDTVEKRAGVEARLLVEELAELPAPVAEGLYRIAQEALNNAVKHAQATSVTVYLRSEGKGIALEVVDNGQGFDPNKLADTGGLGLVNMKERARQLNGSLEINSVPGVGTSLKVKVEVS
jgi:PAS domain S-box-containing protein